MGGWGGQMMMFDDKVGGWGWLNDDVIKKYTRKKTLFACTEKKVGIFLKKLFLCGNFFMISLIQVTDFFFLKNEPELVCSTLEFLIDVG